MALDIRLRRQPGEPWGFRLIGGSDFQMPLTVVQTQPSSPASHGLLNGDQLIAVSGLSTDQMTHEAAQAAILACGDELVLQVVRGTYDLVLEDSELMYEPIEQADFVQSSEPSEVFTPLPDLNLPILPELPSNLEEKEDLPRSSTASPFVLPSKPYRPFSTEPILQVPPLEEPIILNPGYHDEFGKVDEDFLPKTKFKLPISEQYDPQYGKEKKQKKTEMMHDVEFMKRAKEEIDLVQMEETAHTMSTTAFENVSAVSQMQRVEMSSMVKKEELLKSEMKEVSDMIKVEELSKSEVKIEDKQKIVQDLALSLVDESITKAVSVTEELKKQTGIELLSSKASKDVIEVKNKISETDSKISKHVNISKIEDVVEVKDKITETDSRVSVKTAAENFETVSKIEDKQITAAKQEIEETIVSGTVKRISTSFDSDLDLTKATDRKDVKQKTCDAQIKTQQQKHDKISQEESKSTKTVQKSDKVETKTAADHKMSTSRLLAEQRAYTIGLQTIPNIKGSVHSSYHYDLLLKTFFIHLTDVMVALSRFILAEPILSIEGVSQDVKEQREETVETVKKEERCTEESEIRAAAVKSENKTLKDETKVVAESINDDRRVKIEKQTVEKHMSGSQMAQLTAKKSDELIQGMDAVISEFQTKAGVEELDVTTESTRSRSRIEEEVAKESDLLEWLSKGENQTTIQEKSEKCSSETKQMKTECSTSEASKLEIKRDDRSRSKSREGRTIYVATVESHVYTNKDVVFEDQFSDTSSEQSGEAVVTDATATQVTDKMVAESTQIASEAVSEEVREAAKFVAEKIEEVQHSKAIKSVEKSEEVEQIQLTEAKVESVSEKSEHVQMHEFCEAEMEEIQLSKATTESSVQVTEKVEETQLMEAKAESVSEKSEHIQMHEICEAKIEEIQVSEATTENSKQITEKIEETQLAEAKVVSVIEKTEQVEIQEICELKTEEITEQSDESQKVVVEEEEIVVSFKAPPSPPSIAKEEVEATVQIFKEITPPAVEQIIIADTSMTASFKAESTFQSTATKTETFEQTKIEDSIILGSIIEEKTKQDTRIEESTAEMQKRRERLRKLSLKSAHSSDSFPSTISTPTPATVPPTPLTDEYIFRLECPMPKNIGIPEPEEPSPEKEIEHEDPHIVKKRLNPHIETSIERIVYDLPLATPVETKDAPEFKPLNGELKEMPQEDIKEIERKSSLLASVIDETIKSIQEYNGKISTEAKTEESLTETLKTTVTEEKTKTEQAIVTETQPMYTSFVKEAKTTVYADVQADFSTETAKLEEEFAKMTQLEQTSTESVRKLSENAESVRNVSENAESVRIVSENAEMVRNVSENAESVRNVSENAEMVRNVSENVESVRKLSAHTNIAEVTQSIDQHSVLDSIQRDATENVAKETSHVTFKVADLSALGKEETKIKEAEVKVDPMQGYRPVVFNPDELKKELSPAQIAGFRAVQLNGAPDIARPRSVTIDGEFLGTNQGIISGLEDTVMDAEVAKELGKPGISEDKIAELMSGESEMLREAHVMGVDFKKIKPTIEKLKDSEVLKALNDELTKTKEEIKKDERKWTTFLQKPQRVAPTAKFGYHGWLPQFFPPEDFETGLLPWEQRAANEPPPPPVSAEDPILIPEEGPVFLEAVDPLGESEVPDLEETGITLPPEETEPIQQQAPEPLEEEVPIEVTAEETPEVVEEEEELTEEMEQNKLAEQLLNNVQSMVDPNATLEQQLSQMRAQVAALAQLPAVIQHSLELVSKQLMSFSQLETKVETVVVEEKTVVASEEIKESQTTTIEETTEQAQATEQTSEEVNEPQIQKAEEPKPLPLTSEEITRMREEEALMLEEQAQLEQQKKVAKEYIQELMELQLEHESRQVKQHPTPRVGKPKPVFGPLTPQERPMVLPGGRKWRKPKDAYNDAFFAETLAAQAEIIQGTTKGSQYESFILPYDQRINFMKYEKPPISLDHLKDSDTYKMIHNMEQAQPLRRVDLLTPVIAECDYLEKCRSQTPCQMPRGPTDCAKQLQP